MAKMGRPRKEIEWDIFDKICAMPIYEGTEEVAERIGLSVDSIERKLKERFGEDSDVTFAGYIRQQRSAFCESILGAQHNAAKKGNATILIWLGKQYLGQRDKVELSGPDGKEFVFKYKVD